jgi:Ca-activated chloride channel family protein
MEGGEARSYRYSFELSGGPTPDASFLMILWATRRSAQILEELDLGEFEDKAGESLRKELTDELISLARKYGVLTPFTSFLAMEDQDLNRKDENFREAAARLGLMGETSGRGAVQSRSLRGLDMEGKLLNPEKRSHRNLDIDALDLFAPHARVCEFRLATSSPDAKFGVMRERLIQLGKRIFRKKDSKVSARGSDNRLKPFHDGNEAPGSGAPASAAAGTGILAGDRIPPETIGGRAFFRKGGGLVEGDLSDDELKAAKEVKQFSKEYFRLAAELPPEGLGWLSQDTPLVFRWKGEVYRIVPVTGK